MIVSVDMSDDMVAQIDALLKEPELPAWPFKSRTLNVSALTPADQRQLFDYHAAFAAYERAKNDPARVRNRSAALRMIVAHYFACQPTTVSGGNTSSAEAAKTPAETLKEVRAWAARQPNTEAVNGDSGP